MFSVSLCVPQTISDAREAFRNVSSIVRETINEAARDPAASSTAAGDQMMMAAANTADNEIGGGAASTTVAADPRMAGQTIGKLLGRNYRGLRRLFNSELRSAVKVGVRISNRSLYAIAHATILLYNIVCG
jgi:hypothetical protein